MARVLGAALLGLAVLSVAGVAVGASSPTASRPRGAVENCSTTPGWGRRDDFTSRQNLIVGPLALERAGTVLAYAANVGGNKLFVYVRGGHRVTLELPFRTRRDGLKFGPHRGGSVPTRRVVTFIACRRGERTGRFDGWPVTSWVGFLLASSPRCVPLRVWVDDEPRPRRAVIRFGVASCD
jgi:hypothetical protein